MDKKIPTWAMWVEPELQMQLIEGLLRGDGSVTERGRKSVCTISWELAEGLRLLLLRNGIMASVSRSDYDRKPEGSAFRGCGWSYRVGWMDERDNAQGGLVHAGSVVSRVWTVEKTTSDLPVYGLAVEEDESYYASSLMHHNSNHVLEHFTREETPQVLREWVRILKPGGEFQIIVPNLEWAAERIRDGVIDDNVLNVFYSVWSPKQPPEQYHKMGFTPKTIVKYLTDAGLENFTVKLDGYHIMVTAHKPMEKPEPVAESEQKKLDKLVSPAKEVPEAKQKAKKKGR
jgi:hypothetical protein